MGLRELTERLGDVSGLDPAGDALRGQVQRLKDSPGLGTTLWKLARGSWLGHPVHPVLTDVPIGLWTSAVVLDWLAGEAGDRSADTLIALGVLAAVPTAATGVVDWSESSRKARRQGLVHATSNTLGLTAFLASLAARRRDRGRGRAWALLAYGCVLTGAYIGGHLAYVEGVGVERRAAVEPAAPPARTLT